MIAPNIWEGPSDENEMQVERLKTGNHFLIIQASGPGLVGYAFVKDGLADVVWFDPHEDETPEQYTPDHFDSVNHNVTIEDLLACDYYFRVQLFYSEGGA